jgi:hypothetical protein
MSAQNPANATVITGQPSLMLAALRVGGNYKIDDIDQAIKDAVELARECDAVICVTGGNLDWETEGADRTQFALPGATDILVSKLLETNRNTVIGNISVSLSSSNSYEYRVPATSIGIRIRLPLGGSSG